MTMTADGPRVGDVVLLKTEPDYFAVLDYHDAVGWNLIRIVRASKLGRYRMRYVQSIPVRDLGSAGLDASSFVRETKEVSITRSEDFLAVNGTLVDADLSAARRLVGKP